VEILILAAVAWSVLTSGPADLIHAAKGTTSPRHTERMARMAAAEKRREAREARHRYQRPRRGAMRNYFSNAWEDAWEEMARKRPERMAKAKERREKRHARRARAWRAVQEAAGKRWDERTAARQAAAEKAGTPGADKPEEKKPAEAPGQPGPGGPDKPGGGGAPVPAAGGAGGTAAVTVVAPILRLVPGTGPDKKNTATKGSTAMANTNVEAVGLQGALDYTSACMSAVDQDKGKVEGAIAMMDQGRVGATVTAYGPRIQEAYDAVRELFAQLNAELAAMTTVRESYDAVPDAGEKDWLQAGR
jgi:hypothetical protein